MSNLSLIEFKNKLPKLSANEKAVLKLLLEAGRLIAPLYEEQEILAKKGLTREEIESAGKKDPAVLSPYTVVEKKDGKIVVTPYHLKYEKFLKPIVEKLVKASEISDNKEFANALNVQAEALLNGSYEKAITTWLKTKRYVLDISIEPVEHLDDKLFFGKATYQCWIGTFDIEGTERLNNYKSIVLGARRESMMQSERVENYDKVKARVLDLMLISGLMARIKFVGVNLPVNIDVVEKYGSEVTIFNQTNDIRMREQIMPTFNKIFSNGFKQGFKEDDLRRGSLRYVAMHELAHSFLYYRNSAKNLQDLFQPIYELSATLLGLRMAGSLLLKDRINNKQLESMLIAYISRCFYQINKDRENKSMVNYTLGSTIFINFMLESGALKRNGDILVVNFMKIFVSLHDLSNLLERLLSSGTRKDAESFVKKYTSL